MTRLPTDAAVRNLTRQVREAPLERLEDRLLAVLARARTPTNAPDGYPASTIGSGLGGAELTSVEAAAEALCFGAHSADQILKDAEQAAGYLLDAAQALGALSARLDHADRISSTLSRSESGGAGECQCCEDWVSGSADDRLRSGFCDACRKAWERAGRPDRAIFVRERRSGRAS